jgi:hypothetical protein
LIDGPALNAETLQEAAWAMKFAFASYGMLLYLFAHGPAYGCLQVCCGRNCGLLVGTAHGRKQRNKLDLRLTHNLNREATQQAAGLADRDLLDVRYEGEVPHVLPYFIAADEETKSVVVAIRGGLTVPMSSSCPALHLAALPALLQPERLECLLLCLLHCCWPSQLLWAGSLSLDDVSGPAA